MLLPNLCGADMQRVASRVAEGLADLSGAISRFTFESKMVCYPEQASTAYEMEQIAHSFSVQKVPGSVAAAR
jgi:hypothetical protein